MNDRKIEHEFLDEKDEHLLKAIISKRRIFLFKLFLSFGVVALYASYRITFGRVHSFGHVAQAEYNSVADNWPVWLLRFAWMQAMSIAIVAVVYYKSVYLLTKDLNSGIKEKIPHIIVRKQDFPLVDKYYVWIDNEKKPNYEVGAEFYYSCSEGDTIYLYRTQFAKFFFERNGKYDLV
jgi:hypothetical protein